MHKTCPTNRDFRPLLAQYLGIFAVQDLAADQVTVVGVELVVLAELVVGQQLAVAVAVPDDYLAAATLANCICLVLGNNFVDSKAFEVDCSFHRFVTCTDYSVDFYKIVKSNKIKSKKKQLTYVRGGETYTLFIY